MIRHATIFWVAVAGLFLSALTVVGSEVRDRRDALVQINKAIAWEHERIHVLKAERAYLASPERIAARAEAELGLVEFEAARVLTIADLPDYEAEPAIKVGPEGARPLLLSRLDIAIETDSPIASAAFLPPPRLETADGNGQTAWMILTTEPRAE